MTQDSPKSYDGREITAAEVAAYLKQNPDFLRQHPEALDNQLPPERELGDGVVDFQSALIDRLREDVAGHTVRQRELLDTSRANLTIQTRVHDSTVVHRDADGCTRISPKLSS